MGSFDPRYAASKHTTAPINFTLGLHAVSIHHTSPPVQRNKHPITANYSINRLERMKGQVGLDG